MPDLLTFLILTFAAYRLTRLGGWDEFPLAARIRSWVIGETWTAVIVPDVIRVKLAEGERLTEHVSQFPVPAMQEIGRSADAPLGPDAEQLGLPGKQPHSEVEDVRPSYSRPVLAHLVHCPFCLGWWVSLSTYLAWWACGAPGETSPAWFWRPVVPFAISGAVGLIAKNLDP